MKQTRILRNMRKMFLSVGCGLLLSGLLTSQALAGGLDWLKETAKGKCPAGKLVININHGVLNDVDSAVGGGAWATDNYKREVMVIQAEDGSFCALTRYRGTILTDDGKSPGGIADALSEGIKGTIRGGYRTTIFTGTLDPTPAHARKGNIGTFDYGCDVETDSGEHETCTGLFSWPGTYFTSHSDIDFDWWGWIYRTPNNGTWINACDGPDPDCPGNSGDITD